MKLEVFLKQLLYEYETSRVNSLQGKRLDALLLDGGGQGVILKLS